MIARISEGLSRRINILADKALLAAYSSGSHQVDNKEIRIAAQDARFSPLQPKAAVNLKPLGWGLAGAAVAAAIAILSTNSSFPPVTPAALLPGQATSAQPPATPQAPLAKRLPAAPTSDNTPPANIRFGPLTRQHLAQYDDWIAHAPRNHYFIQLLAADATQTGRVEGFLARAIEVLDPVQLRTYRSNLSGRDRVGIIYGDFESREEAAAAMLALPETIKAAQPFPRQVSKLH
jgi:septal ring-binding cell division protein DamX